jgi:hypothetical protein
MVQHGDLRKPRETGHPPQSAEARRVRNHALTSDEVATRLLGLLDGRQEVALEPLEGAINDLIDDAYRAK